MAVLTVMSTVVRTASTALSSERSSNSRSSSTGGVGRVACSHHTYICTGCEGGVPRGVREWSHGCVRERSHEV